MTTPLSLEEYDDLIRKLVDNTQSEREVLILTRNILYTFLSGPETYDGAFPGVEEAILAIEKIRREN